MLHFACTDSDEADPKLNVDGGLTNPDGSVSQTDGQVLPDVVIPNDVQVDVDAGPQPVTVRALSRGLPAAGVTIVWGDANGAVVDTSTTDAQGLASKLVASGTMVTAILGTATKQRLVTMLAVEPGDVLTAVDTTEDEDNGPGSVTIDSIPANPPVGLTGYTTQTGRNCAGFINAVGTLPASVSAYNRCQHAGRTSLLVTAEQTSTELAFAYKKDIALNPDGGDTVVSIDGGSWTPMGSHKITVVNGPTDAGSALLVASEFSSGVKLSRYTYVATPDGGPQSGNIAVHPGYADTTVAEASYSVYNGPTRSHRGVAAKAGADGGTTLDFTGALPFIRSFERDGGADAGPQTVTWSAEGPLTNADGAFIRFGWTDDLVDGGSVQGSWTFVAPPTTTSIKLPSLPASYGPSDAANTDGLPVVVFFESPSLNGYADVRKAAGALPPTLDMIYGDNYYGLMPELPVDGVVNFTAITNPGD